MSNRRRLGSKIRYYDRFVDADIDISSGWRRVVARKRHVRKFRHVSRPLLIALFPLDISRIFEHVAACVDKLIRVQRITCWFFDFTLRIVGSSDVDGSLRSSYEVSRLTLIVWCRNICLIYLALLRRQVCLCNVWRIHDDDGFVTRISRCSIRFDDATLA